MGDWKHHYNYDRRHSSLGYLIPQALEILNKRHDLVDALITHSFGLDQLHEAFETMGDRSAQVGKIVIDMPVATAAEPAELTAAVQR